MIKTSTNNIAKGENEINKRNERGNTSFAHHLDTILNRFSKRIQKKGQKILLALLGILVAFLLLELFLRVSEKKTYDLSPCTSLDKNFHHVMIPGKTCRFQTDEWDVIYKINSLGLRDEEIPQNNKEANEFRILILGDSFVQGHGVQSEKTFAKILEEKLDGDSAKKFRVINSGVYGYSPLIEYLYLKEKGGNLKPDLVILAFDLTDFFEDRQRFKELEISYPQLSIDQLIERIAQGQAEFDFAKINSQSASSETKEALPMVSAKIKLWFRKNFKVYAKFADFVKKKNSNTQQDVINQGNIDKDIVAILRGDKISNEDYERLWQLPIENIELMRDLLKKEGIDFIVVGIPDAVQVSDQEWPGREGLAYPKHFIDPRGPFQDKLSKELSNLNIPFINMLDDFRQSNTFPLYFSYDGHWRESGHKLAADLVYNTLNTPDFYRLLNK